MLSWEPPLGANWLACQPDRQAGSRLEEPLSSLGKGLANGAGCSVLMASACLPACLAGRPCCSLRRGTCRSRGRALWRRGAQPRRCRCVCLGGGAPLRCVRLCAGWVASPRLHAVWRQCAPRAGWQGGRAGAGRVRARAAPSCLLPAWSELGSAGRKRAAGGRSVCLTQAASGRAPALVQHIAVLTQYRGSTITIPVPSQCHASTPRRRRCCGARTPSWTRSWAACPQRRCRSACVLWLTVGGADSHFGAIPTFV